MTLIVHHAFMHKRMVVTRSSQVFVDDRGPHRVLRISWHPEQRMSVLSAWRGDQCVSTFRLPAAQVPAFARALTDGLNDLAAGRTAWEPPPETMHGGPYDPVVPPQRGPHPADTMVAPMPQPHPRPRNPVARWVADMLDKIIDGCTRFRDRLRER